VSRLSVAVVQGGPSAEANVSRSSAAGVAAALRDAGHEVVRLELDAHLYESLRTGGFDVVFPVVHGAVGEDGCLQGMLEILELSYVGSGVLASALSMDKPTARVLFEKAGLPVARGLSFRRGADLRAAAEEVRAKIGRRVVVKPAASGSAIGVVRLADATEEAIARALEDGLAGSEAMLVEHFAVGREITCSVLDLDGGPRALAATEIRSPHDAFYTYEARYAPGRSVHTCPAPLGPTLTERVHAVAVAAHRALGCRDLSRVDFVVGDDGEPEAVTLLEVNTLPGMTPSSLYPEAAAAAGLPFPTLCDRLVRHARARGPSRRPAPRPLPS
jgi:D-alanine-D-alanine ligase